MGCADQLRLDVRYALRSLRRSPGFVVVVLTTLVAGVAAVTTLFSYINAIYFAELPYHLSHRTVGVGQRYTPFGYTSSAQAASLLREPSRSFERVSVYAPGVASLEVGGEGRQFRLLRVDTSFAPLFALQPAAGRLLRPEEILAGQPVAMISAQLWNVQYGADSSAIGSTIRLGTDDHRIVGVLPAGFRFPYQTDIIAPLDERVLGTQDPEPGEYFAIARMRDGVTKNAARAEMSVLAGRVVASDARARVLMVSDEMLDRRGRNFLPMPGLFMGIAIFVLLIACANVANLFLARGAERRAELAIRASLGASRARLVRQALTETLLLGGVAAAVGTALAPLVVRAGLSVIPTQGFPSWFRVTTDYRVLAFALGVLLLVTLAVGLAPALEGTRFDLARALKVGGDPGATSRVARNSARGLAAQLTFGVALLVCAVLFVRSYRAIERMDFGYPADSIATVQVLFDHARYATNELRTRFLEDVMRDVRRPGVRQVAVRGYLGELRAGRDSARRDARYDPRLVPDDDTTRAVRLPRPPTQYVVSDEYFPMLGLRIREGRPFLPSDGPGSPLVAVVSANVARTLWPTAAAVGRTVQVGADREAATIVGVVDDVPDLRGGRAGYTGGPLAIIYYSARQAYASQGMLLARGDGDVHTVRAALVSRVRAADPALVIWRQLTLAGELDEARLVTRGLGGLVGAFALVALALAMLGTWGMVAFNVARRTREIGVRMALGGTHGAVVRHIMGGTLRVALLGMVLGVGLGHLLARALQVFLFGVTASDPFTYLAVCVLFLAVAALASWLPARRATRVDPLVALRAE